MVVQGGDNFIFVPHYPHRVRDLLDFIRVFQEHVLVGVVILNHGGSLVEFRQFVLLRSDRLGHSQQFDADLPRIRGNLRIQLADRLNDSILLRRRRAVPDLHATKRRCGTNSSTDLVRHART